MKVFISWSGPLSKRLAEAIRDWLPNVIQLVTPYFTPSDIEKGARWSTDIAKELEHCQVGLLCVTQDSVHSDWVLFEAGALSKSLDRAHVCPLLFGITNADLAGPLKQFQTTQYEKAEFHKLLAVINSRLGDHKLPPKTLDAVFEKWWPDLKAKIDEVLADEGAPEQPLRSDRELLEEVLQLARLNSRRSMRPIIATGAIKDIFSAVVELHDDQAERIGGYQDVLDILQKMDKALNYLASRYKGDNDELDELIARLRSLDYSAREPDDEMKGGSDDEDIPF